MHVSGLFGKMDMENIEELMKNRWEEIRMCSINISVIKRSSNLKRKLLGPALGSVAVRITG